MSSTGVFPVVMPFPNNGATVADWTVVTNGLLVQFVDERTQGICERVSFFILLNIITVFPFGT